MRYSVLGYYVHRIKYLRIERERERENESTLDSR